ncbi:MAG: NTP transferase domain-containing protein [Fimbriimonadaceae bacterium]|nr:NTP transferase domain-containing protein [Chthonomonadaceae bacterium]MCO5295896.1 NTP transferase domain-containing protein [Fimbriimonadaceae bacterium]
MILRDAILPAGGRLDPETAARAGTEVKALASFGDQTILERTIGALRESGHVRRIIVIGPTLLQGHPSCAGADAVLEEAATGPDNIFLGVDHLAAQDDALDEMLIVTTDLPFLSGEIVRSYLGLCPDDREFCVPLISRGEFNARYPGATATFVTLRDGEFTAGCMYAAKLDALRRARPHIERVFEQRKNKLGMARLLGLGFVWGYLRRTLTVADIERKVQSLLDCRGAAIAGSPPELAYDIDDLEDFDYASRHVGEAR